MSWSDEIEAGFGDLLVEVGVDVLWTDGYGVLHLDDAGNPKRALFREPGETLFNSAQISNEFEIEYREADFLGIARLDRVDIGARTFQVREILEGDDSVLRTAKLKRIGDGC